MSHRHSHILQNVGMSVIGYMQKEKAKKERVESQKAKGRVLLAVVKDKRDLELILKKKWYRIPIAHAPRLRFQYLAFYQPISFGRFGKRIEYYAYVGRQKIVQRKKLLPKEAAHPRANEYYVRVMLQKVLKLPRAIRNTSPRRVSFGFTTLERLRKAKNILQLYSVAETEVIIAEAMKKAGINFLEQKYVIGKDKNGYRRYRIDFAIPAGSRGGIAIECDNKKAHRGKRQLARDNQKDAWLKRQGWKMVRLKEKDILENLGKCVQRINRSK